jgi:hypothetical protein
MCTRLASYCAERTRLKDIVTENKFLMTIYGPKRVEVAVERRKLRTDIFAV